MPVGHMLSPTVSDTALQGVLRAECHITLGIDSPSSDDEVEYGNNITHYGAGDEDIEHDLDPEADNEDVDTPACDTASYNSAEGDDQNSGSNNEPGMSVQCHDIYAPVSGIHCTCRIHLPRGERPLR